jgi:hypothetical protein
MTVVGVMLAPATGRAQLKCGSDKDCEGDLVCDNGTCAKPGAPAAPGSSAPPPLPAPPEAPSAAPAPPGAPPAPSPEGPTKAHEGESCMSRTDCDQSLSCRDFKCVSPTVQSALEGEQKSRLGLLIDVFTPLGGTLGNHTVGVSVGPEFSIGLGPIRYHGYLAFDTLNGFNGGRADLLGFGFPITVAKVGPKGRFEIEPTLSLFTTEWLAGSAGFQMFGSQMLGVQGNWSSNNIYCSFQPVGFELRDYTWQGDSQDSTVQGGPGFNYVLRGSCGVQF